MTYQELIDRILLEAQRGSEQAELANLNTQSVIEAIMPSVLQDVAIRCADDPDKQSLLRRSFTIAITDGVGTLDPLILTARLTGGMVSEPDDSDVLPEDVSFVPQYLDYVAAKNYEGRLGYWCVNDTTVYYASPNDTTYAAFNGNITYLGASTPEIPADPGDPLDWGSQVESDVIDWAAELLRGAKMMM
jgi:hypothetical protein